MWNARGCMVGETSQGCQILIYLIYLNWGNIPNCHKVNYQIAIPNGCNKFQIATEYTIFPFLGTPKFTKILIFGLKKYHLATLQP
jgi:hypothetical protein